MYGVGLLAQSCALPSHPPPGAYVPGYGNPMPYYFSGTNCRAQGEVVADFGPQGQVGYIVYAALTLEDSAGEITVDSYLDTGEPHLSHVTLAASFDSSHFPHGALVPVRIRAWDQFNREYFSIGVTETVNRALLYNYPFLQAGSYGASEAQSHMSDRNYDLSTKLDNAWTRESLIADLETCSLLYVATHSEPKKQWNPPPPGITYPLWSDPPDDPNYLDLRMEDVGSGLPPLNSTQEPPIWFFWLDSCLAGGTNAFNSALWPGNTIYDPPNTNQCTLANAVGVPIVELEVRADEIWEQLAEGYTAHYARSWLGASAEALNLHAVVPAPQGDIWRRWQTYDMRLWGDFTTRVKTVYTGTNTIPAGWFRQ